ncbi:hypothetical protein Kpol_541p23 [Vanderwaltozyma polyspora DSM 70294]|uniref:Uncharacterized protein n=1 Tax=Vanderwaltozyma polyspora (strain ATCC 22028 / DSM 70294 / BCRC 21397 / CBS 2163 / NBRC 10782 / NRRL Y-8283 / UCD 57-17) TaxID=436907 RepID=A7TIW8_VANPO|nr:uncharacterized protein Kpol_541p23 [Vanderwaltozyma polyspora DSM 70294]EDO17780.1 hypothetical protein Kpol_541p23 [Vanderwaltozyma polyspora DSM 70294]
MMFKSIKNNRFASIKKFHNCSIRFNRKNFIVTNSNDFTFFFNDNVKYKRRRNHRFDNDNDFDYDFYNLIIRKFYFKNNNINPFNNNNNFVPILLTSDNDHFNNKNLKFYCNKKNYIHSNLRNNSSGIDRFHNNLIKIKRRRKLLLSSNLKNNTIRYYQNNNIHLTKSKFFINKRNFHSNSIIKNNEDKTIINDQINDLTNNTNNNNDSTINNINNDFPWEKDNEESLNKDTYLKAHMDSIDKAFIKKDYNIINALYQSLKRNDCVPSIETYYKILYSIAHRDLDSDDINYKMFQILSCYEDIIIKNKLKPTDEIYSVLLENLFKGSIISYENNNYKNGLDFFKIALNIFLQVYENHNLSNDKVIKNFLISINYYPGNISFLQINQVFNKFNYKIEDNYKIYFQTLLNYSILINDEASFDLLHKEFTIFSENNCIDNSFDYSIWQLIISGLIEIKQDFTLSTSILNLKLEESKSRDSTRVDLSHLVSNYLISISKSNPSKSHTLWLAFKKLNWLPEFDYNFYLKMILNSKNNWNLTKMYYNYIYPMKLSSSKIKIEGTSSNNLLKLPQSNDIQSTVDLNTIHDYLILKSIQSNDSEMVFKLIQESLVKNLKFSYLNTYNEALNFLKERKYPIDSTINFIELHSTLICDSSKNQLNELNFNSFVNASLSMFIDNHKFLVKFVESATFSNYCQSANLLDLTTITLLSTILKSVMGKSSDSIDSYPTFLKLYSIFVMKFAELTLHDNSYEISQMELLNTFKSRIIENHCQLVQHYYDLNLNPRYLPSEVLQSLSLSNFSKEIIDFYNGINYDTESLNSKVLCYGTIIRNSPDKGVIEFKKLLNKGSSFDYDTYYTILSDKDLVKKVPVNQVIKNAIQACPTDSKCMEKLINTILFNANDNVLESIFLDETMIRSHFVPYVNEINLSNLIQYSSREGGDFNSFLKMISFPERFSNIKNQTVYKSSISKIYNILFEKGQFGQISEYNNILPVLQLDLLLKSFIYNNDGEKFVSYFTSYEEQLSSKSKVELKLEHSLFEGRKDKSIKLVQDAIKRKQLSVSDIADLRSLLGFVQCMNDNIKMTEDAIESEKPKNILQLSNLLCSKSDSYSNMVSIYQEYSHLTDNDQLLKAMLGRFIWYSRICTATPNFEHKNLDRSMKNFLRFKCYLKKPLIYQSDLEKIIQIWTKVNTAMVDALLNNMIESLYLNPETDILYLNNSLSYKFNKSSLKDLVQSLKLHYEENSLHNELTIKIDKSLRFINENLQQKNIAFNLI